MKMDLQKESFISKRADDEKKGTTKLLMFLPSLAPIPSSD